MERRYECQEVADLYGVKLMTVWAWIREKKLPAIKINKKYVVRPEDLQAFEESRKTIAR